MGNDFTVFQEIPEWLQYQEFLAASLRVLFERFDLQWSFTEYSLSSQ